MYLCLRKVSKTTQSWASGTLLNIVGAVFSAEFRSFFCTNRRSLAALSLLRNSQSSIGLHWVSLNAEHTLKRPKGNKRRGEKTGIGAV